MSVIAFLTAKRVSPNKGVDLAVPKLLAVDTAQIMRQFTNLKRGGCVIKYLDANRKSAKAELYEGIEQLNVAVEPNTTTNPSALDLNLAVAGAGSIQGTATQLAFYYNKVTSATGGSADGVILPVAAIGGKPIVVLNATAVPVKVYPAVGAQINVLGANIAFVVAAGTRTNFAPTALLQWLTAV